MKPRVLSRVWSLLLLCLMLSGNPTGMVQNDREQKAALADKLYKEGNELEMKGRYPEALAKYEASRTIAEGLGDKKAVANSLLGIGSIKMAQGDYRAALEFFRKAKESAEETNDKTILAGALRRIGNIQVQQGQYGEARESYERALKAGEEGKDKREVSNALVGMGNVHHLKGNYAQAIDYYQRALKMNEELGDKRGIALTLNNIGVVYQRQGSYADAIDYYQRVLKMREELKDRSGIARALHNIGAVYQRQGSYADAIDYYQRALKMAEELGDKRAIALTLNNIGIVYKNQGSYVDAIDYYQRALKMKEELGDKRAIALTLNNIGTVYNDQGSYADAIDYYQRALKMAEELGDRNEIAGTLTNIGIVYDHQGSHADAIDYYQRALKMMEELGDKRGIALTLNSIGVMYSRQGSYGQAIQCFQRALGISQEINAKPIVGYALNGLGSTYLNLEKYPQAVETLQQALALGEQMKEPQIIWEARSDLARVYEKIGEQAQALKHYRLAIDEIEKVRARASSQERKAEFLVGKIQIYQRLIHLLYKLEIAHPADGYARQAFEYAERTKARSLLDLLTEARAQLWKKIRPELLAKERSAVAKISNLQKSLWEQNAGKGAEEKIKRLEGELKNAYQEHESLKQEIRRLSPEYAALVYPEPILLEQAQKLLDEKTALLEYALGDEASYLFAVTKDKFAVYPLPPRADVERRIHNFIKITAQAPSSKSSLAYLDEGHQLYNRLIKPAEGLLEGKHALVIVPAGSLALLPFAALLSEPAEVAGAIAFKSLPYLVRKYELSFVPSVSVLDSLRRKQEPAVKPKQLVVFADPIYEEEKKSLIAQMALKTGRSRTPGSELTQRVYRSGLRLDRIKYSGMEAEKISGIYGDRAIKYVRERATEERVKGEDLRQYRYIHFATHGIINPDRPEFSAIVLGQEGKEDGFLQVPEVFNLDLDAELVVLSACESGLGKQMPGEGLLGLTRGFLYAGARSVVSSLWKIEDSPAPARFMYEFYGKLSGQTKADALRKTQLEFIGNEKYYHPFYWAAFALVGER